ncbi:DUF6228 family protein [Streptomycetaceae bacterium NBC_01309]
MDESGRLVIGGRGQQASLTLTHDSADDYVPAFIATAEDVDLSARVRVATSPGAGDLSGFLGELADNFRGWEGARTWSSWGRGLVATADYRSRGQVAITWCLARRFADEEPWRVEITTVIEAGAEMSSLSSEVAAFMRTAVGGA